MREIKFTPGPWRYCGQDRGQCMCGQIWSVPADFEVAVAELKNEENDAVIPMLQMMANARLIAAAPEMFLVIEELLLVYKKYANDNPQEDQTFDYAQSLLNRVTGVQVSDTTDDHSKEEAGDKTSNCSLDKTKE